AMEVVVSVEEVRTRLRRQLEEAYGMDGAAMLMDRPPGGWDQLATKEYLDLRLEAVDARFDALEGQLDARFDAIEGRFDAIEGRFGSRFDAVDARFDALEGRFGSRFDVIGSQFEALEHKLMGEIRGLRGDLTGEIHAVRGQIDRVAREQTWKI